MGDWLSGTTVAAGSNLAAARAAILLFVRTLSEPLMIFPHTDGGKRKSPTPLATFAMSSDSPVALASRPPMMPLRTQLPPTVARPAATAPAPAKGAAAAAAAPTAAPIAA